MSKSSKVKKIKLPKRPTHFGSPVDCVNWMKKSVYMIARGRVLDTKKPDEIKFATIGTGFLAAPNRMLTAAHVINDIIKPNEFNQHKDGDIYYLIKHDDQGVFHYRFFTPKLNTTLFVYPEIDLSVIYIEEEFYSQGDNVYLSKDDYIRVDPNFRPIGTEVAVLGYPLCVLDFEDKDVAKPKLGDIILRVDTGVINSKYNTSKDVSRYEFTIAFNPGNSGGPIFDWRTGQVLSIVHGYRSVPINISEIPMSQDEKKKYGVKIYSQETYIDIVKANYSVGYTTPSFFEVLKKHNIIYS